jgi:hypothetical protein
LPTFHNYFLSSAPHTNKTQTLTKKHLIPVKVSQVFSVAMEATLCRLPMELTCGIMSELGSANDVLNLALTCKTMHSSVLNAGGIVLFPILSRHFDSAELALATAHHAAVTAPWKCRKDPSAPIPDQTRYLELVTAFCDRYLQKQATKLQVPAPSFTLPMALYIEEFHATVQELSRERGAMCVETSDYVIVDPVPTEIEIKKIARFLYIMDMVIHLFPRSPITIREQHKPNPSSQDKAFNRFWTSFSP